MDSPLFFDDIPVGRVWVSPRRTVTEADVVNFATMTGDFNPLHVDYDYAAKSHYRRPVAHGLLGLSWVAGLASYFPNVSTVAFTAIRDWQFTRPIFFGDTVFVETACMEKISRWTSFGKGGVAAKVDQPVRSDRSRRCFRDFGRHRKRHS